MNWMTLPLKRYAEFSGRSRRMEYWMFVLFLVICYFVIGIVAALLGFSLASVAANNPGNPTAIYGSFLHSTGGILFALFWLATIVPTVAVGVRRLHDRDMSGWWYLIVLLGIIPLVGLLVSIGFLVLMLLPGTPGPNRFGPDPKDPAGADVFA